MSIIAILIRFKAYCIAILMQIRDFSKVPYLSFFDFGSNKGLCPLFQSPLFGVSSVSQFLFERRTVERVTMKVLWDCRICCLSLSDLLISWAYEGHVNLARKLLRSVSHMLKKCSNLEAKGPTVLSIHNFWPRVSCDLNYFLKIFRVYSWHYTGEFRSRMKFRDI